MNKQLIIEIDEDLHKALKLEALQADKTLKDYVLDMILSRKMEDSTK